MTRRLRKLTVALLTGLLALGFAGTASGDYQGGSKEVRKGWEEDMGFGIQARDGSCLPEFTLLGIKETQERKGEDEAKGDPVRLRDPTTHP